VLGPGTQLCPRRAKTRIHRTRSRANPPPVPPEEGPEFTDYVEVMGTYNPADVALIKSLLDAENITYYFNAEHFMNVEPLAQPVRLMVRADEAERAKEILQDLNLAIAGFDLRKADDDSQNGNE